MRILIADDSNFIRSLIRRHVEKQGHEVVGEAQTGPQACELYKNLSPDVLFVDLIMPEMNGVEVIKRVQSFDEQAQIVMCSSMGHITFIEDAIRAGACDFIVKPFRSETLKRALKKCKKRS